MKTEEVKFDSYLINCRKPFSAAGEANVRAGLKPFLHLLITFTFYFLLFTSYCQAAFRDTSFGVRPEGMGGAFVALADDINSVYYNPAGIAVMRLREANFIYGIPFLGLPNVSLNYMNFSFVYPVKKVASFGVSYMQYTQTELYSENIISLSVAKNINELLDMKPKLFAGVNLKYLSHAYFPDANSKDDPVFADGTAKGNIGADLGVLCVPVKRFSFGLMLKNINSPDVGLKSVDKVPAEISLGSAFKSGSKGVFEDVTVPVEVSMRMTNPAETVIKAGIESWFMLHTFGVRLGYNNFGVDVGFSFYKAVSKKLLLKLDYSAALLSKLDANSGTHRVSFGLRF